MVDVSKASVPLDILYKAGRLDDSELDIIMAHPVDGARILQRFPQVDPLAVCVAFGHHIKDNGTGYPQVPSTFRIGSVTALLEVADIFEALTSLRPYKRPLTARQAFEVLYSMPNMATRRPYIDLLLNAVGLHPIGSRVRTANGDLGVVCGHQDDDPTRPLLRLVFLREDGTLDTETVVEGTAEHDAGLPGESAADAVPIVAVDPEEDLELTGQLA